jgi:hypothetical protein
LFTCFNSQICEFSHIILVFLHIDSLILMIFNSEYILYSDGREEGCL